MPFETADKLPDEAITQKSKLRSVNNTAFQAGEVLRYRLHYGIIDAGEAILQVRSTERDVMGRELLHMYGKGYSLGAFDWFFKVRDTYETYMDKDGLFPWLFIRRVDEGGYKIKQDYTFMQHKKSVDNGEGEVYKVPQATQDMLSAFYYARTIDYSNAKKGDIFRITCFVDDELWDQEIKFIGRETIKTRAGKFRCIKFVPIIQEGRIFKEEEDLLVWITDDGNKIPVLAKAKVFVGSIKMELTGYAGLANTPALVH